MGLFGTPHKLVKLKKFKGGINLEDIVVAVADCPGCGYSHDLRLKRPSNILNCSRGTGTFYIDCTVVPDVGVKVTVQYGENQYAKRNISKDITVSVYPPPI